MRIEEATRIVVLKITISRSNLIELRNAISQDSVTRTLDQRRAVQEFIQAVDTMEDRIQNPPPLYDRNDANV